MAGHLSYSTLLPTTNDNIFSLLAKWLITLGGTPTTGDNRASLYKKILVELGGEYTYDDNIAKTLKKILAAYGGTPLYNDNEATTLAKILRLAEAVEFDPNAEAFFTYAGITDDTQKDAINGLVVTLKDEDIWDIPVGIYPMVGGNATAHSKNLKADTNHITWSGGLTHDANGVTGNGSTGFGNLGETSNFITTNSAHGLTYCRTSSPNNLGRFWGSVSTTGGTRRSDTFQNGGGFGGQMNDDTFKGLGVANFLGMLAMSRTASNAGSVTRNGVGGTWTDAAVGVPTEDLLLLARSFEGFPNDSFSNANIAFASFGGGLTVAQLLAYYNAVQTYQTALGRNV